MVKHCNIAGPFTGVPHYTDQHRLFSYYINNLALSTYFIFATNINLVFLFKVRFSVAYLFKPEDSRHSNPIKLKTFSRVVASLQPPLISYCVDKQNYITKFKICSENICNSEKIVCNLQ